MRLIDADKIKVTEYKDLMGMSHKVVSWEDIRNAPTIDVLDKIRAEIEEAKMVRVTANDAIIEASADTVINPQYKNFTSGLDMAINIIDKYREGEEK